MNARAAMEAAVSHAFTSYHQAITSGVPRHTAKPPAFDKILTAWDRTLTAVIGETADQRIKEWRAEQ